MAAELGFETADFNTHIMEGIFQIAFILCASRGMEFPSPSSFIILQSSSKILPYIFHTSPMTKIYIFSSSFKTRVNTQFVKKCVISICAAIHVLL